MAKFAILEGTKVKNIIICDDKETAEQISESSVVEVTEETGLPSIDFEYIDGFFRSPKPGDDFFWHGPWKNWVDSITYEQLNS
jgi:hypothetical protein